MKILSYRDLDVTAIPHFNKLKAYLEADDFRSAEVKKVGANLYRARLDRSNRMLFSLYRHQEQTYALMLEYIPQHAYEKSRFLRHGAQLDEAKIPAVEATETQQAPQLAYLNPRLPRFHLLDKVLSFDDEQEQIYQQHPPLVIIGSAGSGKTALTLEKMKQVNGEVLYVSRSAFLVDNARSLYYANGYNNEAQEIDFLSYHEYLESIQVPEGKEINLRSFQGWANRQKLPRELQDSHKLFEEFQGAITGSQEQQAWLSRDDYLALGVRQSIYPPELRGAVYDIFERYLRWLSEQGYFDANILSHAWLQKVAPRYDFIVVDEVQDLTNVQLALILRALREPHHFMLCGDANQIVHPNFFSWSKVKSLFWRQRDSEAPTDLIRILNANFRNSPQVTELANRLLRIKHARFGSVDRESNYLVRSCGPSEGVVSLLLDSQKVKSDLDRRTAGSTRFAILVLHGEQKAEVRKYFRTPLVFSIQEAKGLEYENVLLYGFVSGEEKRFRDIAGQLTSADLQGELRYARGKDKGDKSLEIYKFYINALYVAVTRAVKNLYLIEPKPQQNLLALLGLNQAHDEIGDLQEQKSSLDEWRREAHKLELQGKQEQAAEIREHILQQKTVPWQVLKGEALEALQQRALQGNEKKARIALLEYAFVYHDQQLLNKLAEAGFSAALAPDKGLKTLEKKHYMLYGLKHIGGVLREVDRYGVDFRNVFDQTPLMIASRMGNAELAEQLVELGADTSLIDANGLNAFQISLERSCEDVKYARGKLADVYRTLAPPSISIQVEGRLIKLDSHLMEYLMLSLAMALFYQRLGSNWVRQHGLLSSGDFVEALEHFPESLVPARRKKRAYISSILSKNEVSRDDRYNRKLFIRIRQGHYLFNPSLALKVEGQWRNIYQLLHDERLAAHYINDALPSGSHADINALLEHSMNNLRTFLHKLAAGGAPQAASAEDASATRPAQRAAKPAPKTSGSGKKKTASKRQSQQMAFDLDPEQD